MLRGGMSLARINLTWCARRAAARRRAAALPHALYLPSPSLCCTHPQTPNTPPFPHNPPPSPPRRTPAHRGPLDFHRRTLRNLQEATRLESRLCGVIVGTSGRDIPVVGRPMTQLESGWWQHTAPLDVAAGARVTITTRDGAEASGGLLPIAFKEFPGGSGRWGVTCGRARDPRWSGL